MNAILERNDGWVAALLAAEPASAAEYLHQDFALVLVHPAATTVVRDEWLRTLPDYLVSRWEVRRSVLDVYDNTATHLQLIDMNAEVFGVDRSGLFAISDVWIRDEQDVWRVWRRHSTPLTAGPMPQPGAGYANTEK